MLKNENLPPWLSDLQLDFQLGLEGIDLPEIEDDEEVEEDIRDLEN